jgi:2-polyprenyl-3-methyl-5-hydroxy-6-metoxy-1,4-benzoquinol methylase
MIRELDHIYSRIAVLNPRHGKKLIKNSASFDERYNELAGDFFKRYAAILQAQNKSLDYAIDCYLRMIDDVNSETIEFARTGQYSSSTFAEVNNRVYARPQIMEYYMHGLILSQFLWKHHYQMFNYFINTLPRYTSSIKAYLEVGVGHGFYLSEVLNVLDANTTLTAVDISETSIAMAKSFVENNRISYNLANIFEFDTENKYDFITLGEVLEHVEDPLELLLKLNDLLSENGVLFFTTPTNAPAIDHISLFNNVAEIRDVVNSAGLQIDSEIALLSEDVSPEKAEKFKIATLYGAFLKKQNN